MTKSICIFFQFVFMFMVVGCATSNSKFDPSIQTASNVEWLQGGKALPQPDSTLVSTANDEIIRPLDTLEITVFEVEKLGGDFQVDLDGNLKMPLIGGVRAEGKTSYELAAHIEERLGEKYLQNPQVLVRMEASEAERITVEGSVMKPGIYPVRGEITLIQAIALSGGPSEFANLGRVAVFRNVDGVRKAAGFNMKKIRDGLADDPILYGNDIVVVDGADTKKGYRELLRALPLLSYFLIL